MNQITILQTEKNIQKPINLSWQDNPSVQKVLDTVASIIADEYIQIAKQNPDAFSEIASPPSGVRNDRR